MHSSISISCCSWLSWILKNTVRISSEQHMYRLGCDHSCPIFIFLLFPPLFLLHFACCCFAVLFGCSGQLSVCADLVTYVVALNTCTVLLLLLFAVCNNDRCCVTMCAVFSLCDLCRLLFHPCRQLFCMASVLPARCYLYSVCVISLAVRIYHWFRYCPTYFCLKHARDCLSIVFAAFSLVAAVDV